MPDKDFQEFRRAVFSDPDLQRDLRNIEEQAPFKDAVVSRAAALGIDLTVEDVESAMRDGRRSWIERWI